MLTGRQASRRVGGWSTSAETSGNHGLDLQCLEPRIGEGVQQRHCRSCGVRLSIEHPDSVRLNVTVSHSPIAFDSAEVAPAKPGNSRARSVYTETAEGRVTFLVGIDLGLIVDRPHQLKD